MRSNCVKRVLARAVVCAVLLALPACAIPPLRHTDPAPDLPPTFNGVTCSENSAHLGVQEFFNDPLLTSLIEQALFANRELKILEEEVQIAQNEILARRGAYLPFLAGQGVAGLERGSLYTPLGAAEDQLTYPNGGNFPDPMGNFQVGFNLFWQLDIWRQLRNARDAAIQRYFAAIERRNYFVTRLIAENAENYYRLMALDQRLDVLDKTIELQEQSLKLARARLEAGRGTELAVQRFLAEVRKNQSEKLVVKQEVIEVENRINFLLNRFPQPVERASATFFEPKIRLLNVGVPSQLLQNRADIRQAERELEAAGLDVLVARAKFFPQVTITGGIGYAAFDPRFLFRPEALAGNLAGNLVGPLINKKAIQAEYMTANARQLASVYNYQRTVLNAFTEVINRMSMVENYSRSIEIKRQQLKSLEMSVDVASNLFQSARAEYVEVLLAQRDLMDARTVMIDTKRQQLAAIVNTYQALGGGASLPMVGAQPPPPARPPTFLHNLWRFKGHKAEKNAGSSG